MKKPRNLEQLFDAFEDYLTTRRRKLTARTYRQMLAQFKTHALECGLKLTDSPALLDYRTFELFPAYLINRGYASKTIDTYLAGMVQFNRWLIREKLIKPPSQVEVEGLREETQNARKAHGTRLPRLPEADDAPRVIEASKVISHKSPRKERDYALVLFLYTTGCRAFEAANLIIKDVNMGKRQARVIGKGDNEGIVYFTEETAEALREYWKVRGWSEPGDPVFARHDHKVKDDEHSPLTTRSIWDIVNELRKVAGIEAGHFSPHWLRHAAAMEVQRVGKNVTITAKFLRHKGLATVGVYAKALDTEVQDVHKQVFGD